jgi:anti-anti-sigma factor
MSNPEGPLQVESSTDGDQLVLVLAGELDPHTAPVLRDRIDEALDDRTTTLVLDLRGLRFIDSSGLRVIIGAHKDMVGRDGRLVLRAPTETTKRLLDITGLVDHLEVD